MYLLENPLRNYAWGSRTAIAELFGREPSGSPEAEMWIGAHADSPSLVTLHDGGREPLDKLIGSYPEAMLGSANLAAFGPRLPFLTKVLAAGAPLSLQVHPTLEQAGDGYAAENAAGVPQDAPNRNYRDANHKPEMLLALTPFETLCGFRPPADSARIFHHLTDLLEGAGRGIPALLAAVVAALDGPGPEEDALRAAFERLIGGGEETASAVRLVTGVLADAQLAPFEREFATVLKLQEHFPGDPGVLISLLLNRISLQPGEAIYLPAGKVHAYLEGLAVEVMATSDNVLRGGLTPKHVDVQELLHTTEFRSHWVPRLKAENTDLDQQVFRPPFREFQLQRLELHGAAGRAGASAPGASMAAADIPLLQNGPTVVLVLRGSIVLDSPNGDLLLRRGQSAFIPANEAPVLAKLATGGSGAGVADDDGGFAGASGTADDGGAFAVAVTVAS